MTGAVTTREQHGDSQKDGTDITNFDIAAALQSKGIMAMEASIEIVTFAEDQLVYFEQQAENLSSKEANLEREIEEFEAIQEYAGKALVKLRKNRENVKISLESARTLVAQLVKSGIRRRPPTS